MKATGTAAMTSPPKGPISPNQLTEKQVQQDLDVNTKAEAQNQLNPELAAW